MGLLRYKLRRFWNRDTSLSSQAAQQLAELKKTVTGLNRDLEPLFLSVGQTLHTLGNHVQSISDFSSRLSGLIHSTDESNVFCRIEQMIEDTLRGLSEAIELGRHNLNTLLETSQRLMTLGAAGQQTAEMSRHLAIIRTSIHVECARFDEAQKLFQSFVDEMADLVKSVEGSGSNILGDSRQASDYLQSIERTISVQLEELNSLSLDSGRDAQRAQSEMKLVIEGASAVLLRIGKASQMLNKVIGDVIVAVQFQDIVRQRLEHVVEAIETIESEIADGSLSQDSYLNLKVQVVQISESADQVRDAGRMLDDAFRAIIGSRTEIEFEEKCGKVGDSRVAKELSSVLEEVEELTGIRNRSHEVESSIEDGVRHAGEVGEKMSAHVSDVTALNMAMHRNALNAIIKANRLGEMGQSLEVLAQEVVRISHVADENVSRIIGELGEISKQVEQLEAANIDVIDDHEQLNLLIQDMGKVCEEFRQGFDNTFLSVEHLYEEVDSSQSVLQKIQEMGEQMGACEQQLESVVDKLRPIVSGGFEEDRTRLHEHHERYTMAQEREAHKKALASEGLSTEKDEPIDEDACGSVTGGGSPVLAAVSAPVAQSSNDNQTGNEEEFDDNIELF